MTQPIFRGYVKFFRAEQGLGGIESDETPGDVWMHRSVIEGPGHGTLAEGDEVEFRFETAHPDSWRNVATWVRRVAQHSAPK